MNTAIVALLYLHRFNLATVSDRYTGLRAKKMPPAANRSAGSDAPTEPMFFSHPGHGDPTLLTPNLGIANDWWRHSLVGHAAENM